MKVFVCETMIRPRAIPVESSKGDGTFYSVVSSTLWNDSFCECKSFEFRGVCRHVDEIEAQRCTHHAVPVTEEPTLVNACPCGENLAVLELEPEFADEF